MLVRAATPNKLQIFHVMEILSSSLLHAKEYRGGGSSYSSMTSRSCQGGGQRIGEGKHSAINSNRNSLVVT